MVLKTLPFLFAFLVGIQTTYSQVEANLDSLLARLEELPDDTAKVRLLSLIASKHIEKVDYLGALPYAREGDALAESLGDTTGLLIIRDQLAICQAYIGDYDKALANNLSILSYWEKKGDNFNSAKYYIKIALIHDHLDQTDEALKNLYQSLKFWETQGGHQEIANVYWNISGQFKKKCKKALAQGDAKSANKFYLECIASMKKALAKAQEAKDTIATAFYTDNLGFTYDIGTYGKEDELMEIWKAIHYDFADTARVHFETALALFKLRNDTLGSLSPLRNMGLFIKNRGVVASQMGNEEVAANYYQQSLGFFSQFHDLILKLGYEHGIANANKDLGTVYLKLKDYPSAEKHLLQAAGIFKQRGFKMGLLESYELLAETYEQSGDFQKAIAFFKEYVAHKDSLTNEESLKDRNLLIARYEFESKEREIELLKKDKEINAAKLKRQKIQKMAMGTGIFLISLTSTLLVLLLRNRQKREKAEFTKQLLEVKQEALKAQISDHFIANSMQSINRFIESDNSREASRYLLKFSRLIRKVLENSADKSRALVPMSEDLETLEDYVGLEQLRYKDQSLKFIVSIDSGIDQETTLVPPMALQILVENAIKHGLGDLSKGGTVSVGISTVEAGRYLKFSVEDNGVGRAAAPGVRFEAQSKAHGTQLARRLIMLFRELGKESQFQVEDVYDRENRQAGTRVAYQIPFISNR